MALPFEVSGPDLLDGALLAVGSVVLVLSARYVWRASAVVRATELGAPADADAGTLARASGSVARSDGRSVVAPCSGVECVALRSQIEERRLTLPVPLPTYVTIRDEPAAVPFALRTAEGTVSVVEPVRTVTLARHEVARCAAEEDPPKRIAAFERETETIPVSTVWRDPPGPLSVPFRALSLGDRRYSERRAGVGDDVTVVGRVTAGAGIDPLVVSDRNPTETAFRMAKTALGGLAAGAAGVVLGAGLVVLA